MSDADYEAKLEKASKWWQESLPPENRGTGPHIDPDSLIEMYEANHQPPEWTGWSDREKSRKDMDPSARKALMELGLL